MSHSISWLLFNKLVVINKMLTCNCLNKPLKWLLQIICNQPADNR